MNGNWECVNDKKNQNNWSVKFRKSDDSKFESSDPYGDLFRMLNPHVRKYANYEK